MSKPSYVIKAQMPDLDASNYVSVDQKTMYGGKRIRAGDTIFFFASENVGGPGLFARGVVGACESIPKRPGLARQTPRVSIAVESVVPSKKRLGRAQLKAFLDWGDQRPETELNFKLYRQATNKMISVSPKAAAFPSSCF